MIDTHAHLDDEAFSDDLQATIDRAKEAGVSRIFLPAIDLKTCDSVVRVCQQYPGYAYPMLGLHPEEVRSDYVEVLQEIKKRLLSALAAPQEGQSRVVAIGEVGLDYYWSREFESEQLVAFEEQVQWSVETRLPLMIHCRKAQNEMVKLLRHYQNDLPGGVFHCFTGNAHEAEELLQFENFVLGIGGVLTFKKSPLPTVLPEVVPLDRIVLETDSPYMAPVPHRGQRNESTFVALVMEKIAEAYGVTPQEVEQKTDENVRRVFGNV